MLNGKKLIGVTLRTDALADRDERRASIDTAWLDFIARCRCTALPLGATGGHGADLFAALPIDALLLTGGADPAWVGGLQPERDTFELDLLAAARRRGLPVIGVCRGMQIIQHAFDVPLEPVDGHVAPRQEIVVGDERRVVNSYHRFGAFVSAPELEVWARSDDGVVKAVRHVAEPIIGMMWHPERRAPFADPDLALFSSVFGSVQ